LPEQGECREDGQADGDNNFDKRDTSTGGERRGRKGHLYPGGEKVNARGSSEGVTEKCDAKSSRGRKKHNKESFATPSSRVPQIGKKKKKWGRAAEGGA